MQGIGTVLCALVGIGLANLILPASAFVYAATASTSVASRYIVGVYPIKLPAGKDYWLTVPLPDSGGMLGFPPPPEEYWPEGATPELFAPKRHTLATLFKHCSIQDEAGQWQKAEPPSFLTVMVYADPRPVNAPPTKLYTYYGDGHWYDQNFNQSDDVELPWFIKIRMPRDAPALTVDVVGTVLWRETKQFSQGAKAQDYMFGTRMVDGMTLKDADLPKIDNLTLLVFDIPSAPNAPAAKILMYYASVDGWYDQNFQSADSYRLEPARAYVLRVPGSSESPGGVFDWERTVMWNERFTETEENP